MKDQSE